MRELPNKIQWHPAFYAAAELELREDIKELEFLTEYNLSKEPIRIDLLIIKGSEREKILKNEIGHIMRKHNVLEYKSPNDALTIDDFYKVIGYACLYKGYGDSVNKIKASELTVSIFRETCPRELFLTLEQEGYEIEEKYSGIYYVKNKLPFSVQIVVTSRLDGERHSSLRVLSNRAAREDVERFLEEAQKITSPRERNNIDAVLQVSVNANFELYQDIRRDSGMCEALRELMKDEIEIELKKSAEQGMAQGMAQVILNMQGNGFDMEQIKLATGKSEQEIEDIIEGKELIIGIVGT